MHTLRPLVVTLSLLALLASCNLVPPPPTDASLNIGTLELKGVTTGQLQVTASGPWELTTSDSWLGVSPSSGSGDATVQVSVNPSALQPGEHYSGITLRANGRSLASKPVLFSFPRLRGSVVVAEASASVRDPQLQSLASGPGRLLVGLDVPPPNGFAARSSQEFETMAITVAAGGGRSLLGILPATRVAVLEVDDMRRAAAELLADPAVAYVEEDVILLPLSLDAHRLEQWALDVISAEEAWNVADGSGVTVAIIDSGFDAFHPDFGDNVAATYDFVSDTEEITPRPLCEPHGEHVAGIVAAEANNTIGVAGIAKGAQLALLNAGDDLCRLYTSDIVAALEWVTGDEGSGPRAQVANMSLGGSSSIALKTAIANAYAAGVTLVAATGNSASGSVLYPAAYPEVIAVSATGRWDDIASYSTGGPEVFVSAPGGDSPYHVLSTGHYYSEGVPIYDYVYMSGTSMASPAAAAVAALVLSVDPDLTPVGVAGLLADSAEDLGEIGHDETYGYGRIDAAAAVARAQERIGMPSGWVLRHAGEELPLPVVERFVGDHVGGTLALQVGSDDDWDGVLEESGEYFGELTVDVAFEGEFFDVVIPVSKLP